jgi:Arc/MetJ-type ribon-helix-helix transcriptional regulator
MPRLKRRTKVISIRLSDEEYEQIQSMCAANGAYSISQLARAAMQLLIQQENGTAHAVMETRMNEIHVRVSALDREVGRISSLMGLTRMESAQ